jgi:hypothetical protein
MLRVVRLSRRTPSLSSNARTVWLSVEGEIPNCAAALMELRCSATATKALSSANRVPLIRKSTKLADPLDLGQSSSDIRGQIMRFDATGKQLSPQHLPRRANERRRISVEHRDDPAARGRPESSTSIGGPARNERVRLTAQSRRSADPLVIAFFARAQ